MVFWLPFRKINLYEPTHLKVTFQADFQIGRAPVYNNAAKRFLVAFQYDKVI